MSEKPLEDEASFEGEASLVAAIDHSDLFVKYTFYLLAVDGAAVGFALTQTKEAVLAWSQIPLGFAMVSWSLSFWFGLRQLDSVLTTLTCNSVIRDIEAGNHPKLADSLNLGAFRSWVKRYATWGLRYNMWQIRTLLIGLFFYVGWHILEMYLRQPPTS